MTQSGLGGPPFRRIRRHKCLFDVPAQMLAEYFQAQAIAVKFERVAEMLKRHLQSMTEVRFLF